MYRYTYKKIHNKSNFLQVNVILNQLDINLNLNYILPLVLVLIVRNSGNFIII